MRSSLVILSLTIFIGIDATTQDVCPEPPKVENAQISRDSIRPNYTQGDEIDFSCNTGYVSLRKITYVCIRKKWTRQRSTECALKRCEMPSDIPNGHYRIKDGNGFVVGTTIEYTCNDGYQMMSRFFTRTCRPSGWDNQLPACEVVSCAADGPSDKRVKTQGLPDYGDLIRDGHRLQFSCEEQGYILKGPKEITCQSNGEWNDKFPHCEEITCKLNETNDINVERISGHEGLFKPGHQIKLSCVEQKMIMRDNSALLCQDNGEWNASISKCEEATCIANITNQIIDEKSIPGVIKYKPGTRITVSCGEKFVLKGKGDITCQEDGEWSSGFPTCAEVTCQKQELSDVQILMGHPGISAPYLPGHVLVFKCNDVNMKMYDRRIIECQSNGKWDYPFPKCLETACVANLANMNIEGCPHPGVVYKPGDRLKVSCDQGLILQGPDGITCQEDGQWSSPFPSCVEATCIAKITNQIIDGRYNPGVIVYKPGTRITVSCGEKFVLKGIGDITCQEDGEWSSGFPTCAANSCGPPPSTNHLNADTTNILDHRKTLYRIGEKVEYACFKTFIMEGEPFLTCRQDGWIEQFKCIPPCLASVEEMDKRNIQLVYGRNERMFCPHKDHITFACKGNKKCKENSVRFRQQCQYGKMTLPECE
ncbi:sushi, von Willebrand factor type A, EGF and pentraxin domain-containing protein 1-like [Triplophysa dalaica]|uniref:sushi, von Willebrand factor type A, EGF and pentraxin domain-containing protein 1-like n=1 Tax=Triplophysa dalaica TaxID=1582913 RepID=UPI0024DFB65D|nr:sushi, von Willebrand factor type A, EGF and pentraxin domain-containing protein 1-like [Triplophysa dalaica]